MVVVVEADPRARMEGCEEGGVVQIEGRLGLGWWLELAQGHPVETAPAESLLGFTGRRSACWQPLSTMETAARADCRNACLESAVEPSESQMT